MTTDIDAIGILAEHEKKGLPITLEQVNTAVVNLYGSWNDFPYDSKLFIENAIANGNFEYIYSSVKNEEKESKDILIPFALL